jgi:hypothetical protein
MGSSQHLRRAAYPVGCGRVEDRAHNVSAVAPREARAGDGSERRRAGYVDVRPGMVGSVDGLDALQQPRVAERAVAGRPAQAVMDARPRDTEQLAGRGDRVRAFCAEMNRKTFTGSRSPLRRRPRLA